MKFRKTKVFYKIFFPLSYLAHSYFIKWDVCVSSCCSVYSTSFKPFLFIPTIHDKLWREKLHLLKSFASIKIQVFSWASTWPAKTPTQLMNRYLIPSNTSNLSDLGVKLGRGKNIWVRSTS